MYPEVKERLPVEEKEWNLLPRQYLANLIYTVVGQPFQDWVDVKIQERNEKVVKEQNMLIELDPEIAAVFKASTAVSCKYLYHLYFLCSRTCFDLSSTCRRERQLQQLDEGDEQAEEVSCPDCIGEAAGD